MGFPAQMDPHEHNHPSDDTVTHFFAREGQLILRVVVCLSIIATAITAITFWFWAFIPALTLLASYLLLICTNEIERKTRLTAERHGHYSVESEGHSPDATHVDPATAKLPLGALSKEGTIGWEIIIGCVIAATVLAASLLPMDLIVIGVFFIFAYSLLVMAPVWLGWIHDEVDEERADVSARTDALG